MKSEYEVHHQQVGPAHARRFIVSDSLGRYWTGDEFSDRRNDALLFDIEVEAEQMASKMAQFKKPPRRFKTTLTVEVNCNEPFVLAQLQEFLRRRCCFWLDCPGAEPPLDEAAFAMFADWKGLKDA